MKEIEELLTPKRDIIFKKLFGEKGNERILKGFLEAILDIEIEDLTLDLSTDLLPDYADGKECRVDVRTRLIDGTEINIEMQTNKQSFHDKRCLDYWAKLYSNQLKKGEIYTKLNKTICIWIIDDEIWPEFNEYQSDWKIIEQNHHITNYFNDLEFHMIELKKFREDVTIKSSRKNFWLWFIDHTNKEMVEMACMSSEEIAEAKKEYERITAIPGLVDLIEAEERAERDKLLIEYNIKEEARAKGREEGRKEGRKEGKEQEQIEIAKKMLNEGIDIEIIAKITGLTKERIEELR